MRRGLAIVVLLAASPALAGVRWTTEHRQMGAGTPLRATIAVEGNRIRFEHLGDAGEVDRVLLFDAGAQKLFLLVPARSTYSEMPTATAQQRAAAEAARAKLPARKAAKALRFVPTGRKRTVAGLECEDTQVFDGTVPLEEDCVVPWGKGGMTKAEVATFEQLAVAMTPGTADPAMGIHIDVTLLPGFPLEREHLDPDGTSRSIDTITSFERVSIPAGDLAVPSTFTTRSTAPKAPPTK